MTYTPTIHDWRASLRPLSQVLRAGGQARDGGMTVGGASVSSPDPGGRMEMNVTFQKFATTRQMETDVSWTISRAMGGALFRVPVCVSRQLVPAADLTVPDDGTPWSEDQPWAGDVNWAADPWISVAMFGAKGSETAVVDMAGLGEIIRVGHVVGFSSGAYDFAHVVMDVTYDGDEATLTISPPLRRDISPAIGETPADRMRFRPKFIAFVANPDDLMAQPMDRRFMSLGPARFVEALV